MRTVLKWFLPAVAVLAVGGVALAVANDSGTEGSGISQAANRGPGGEEGPRAVPPRGFHRGGPPCGPRRGVRGGRPPGPPLGAPSPKERSEKRDQFFAALGKKLGKSAAEVKAAFRGLLKDRLDKAVEAKRLPRERADAILEGFDKGAGPGPGFFHGGPPKHCRGDRGAGPGPPP